MTNTVPNALIERLNYFFRDFNNPDMWPAEAAMLEASKELLIDTTTELRTLHREGLSWKYDFTCANTRKKELQDELHILKDENTANVELRNNMANQVVELQSQLEQAEQWQTRYKECHEHLWHSEKEVDEQKTAVAELESQLSTQTLRITELQQELDIYDTALREIGGVDCLEGFPEDFVAEVKARVAQHRWHRCEDRSPKEEQTCLFAYLSLGGTWLDEEGMHVGWYEGGQFWDTNASEIEPMKTTPNYWMPLPSPPETSE